jgi:hypothetical protein
MATNWTSTMATNRARVTIALMIANGSALVVAHRSNSGARGWSVLIR